MGSETRLINNSETIDAIPPVDTAWADGIVQKFLDAEESPDVLEDFLSAYRDKWRAVGRERAGIQKRMEKASADDTTGDGTGVATVMKELEEWSRKSWVIADSISRIQARLRIVRNKLGSDTIAAADELFNRSSK